MKSRLILFVTLLVGCGDADVTESQDAVPVNKQAAAAAPAPDQKPEPKSVVRDFGAALRALDVKAVYATLSARLRADIDKELDKISGGRSQEMLAAAAEKVRALPVAKEIAKLKVEAGAVADGRIEVRITHSGEREQRETWKVVLEDGQWRIDHDKLGKLVFKLAQPEASRLRKNETAAIATLRNLTSAQAMFQASAVADVNDNGVGEYGTFAELSGATGVRGKKIMVPPVLSPVFGKVKKGQVRRHGYVFAIWLPAKNGAGLAELPYGGADKSIDARKAETNWCCYAWPVEHGKTGKRCFFINQAGDILATEGKGYSGDEGPGSDAAFLTETTGITARTDPGAKANDGNIWKHLP